MLHFEQALFQAYRIYPSWILKHKWQLYQTWSAKKAALLLWVQHAFVEIELSGWMGGWDVGWKASSANSFYLHKFHMKIHSKRFFFFVSYGMYRLDATMFTWTKCATISIDCSIVYCNNHEFFRGKYFPTVNVYTISFDYQTFYWIENAAFPYKNEI